MKMTCKSFLSLFLLISAEIMFVASDVLAVIHKSLPDNNEQAGRRRRRPGSKGSFFEDLEFFKHNADIFAGPAYHIGKGDFFESTRKKIQESQPNFGKTDAEIVSNYFSVGGGLNYRYTPFPKAKDITSMLSFSTGLNFQSRGYSYRYEKKSAEQSDTIINNLIVNEKFRAMYMTIPVGVRFGGRLFVEAGLSLNVMIQGSSKLQLERSAAFGGLPQNNPGIIEYYTIYKSTSRLGGILPIAAPGFNIAGGMYFNENLGLRFSAEFTGNYFKAKTNPEDVNFTSTIVSLQLLGTIN
jgi:hypothetical protein